MALFTAQGVLNFLGLGATPPLVTLANKPLAWQTRLREAAYTPPSGAHNRIKFMYVDVSREFDLRGTAHEFPQVNDAYVQRTGFGSRRYPLVCYFSGPNHDLLATAFEAALMEPGIGVLEHPMYGTLRNVVPFGTVTRTDALATAANQSVVQVTFWTTTGKPYPSAEPQTQNEILQLLGNFNVQAAQQFAIKTNLKKATDRAGVIATVKGFLKTVSGAMSKVSTATASVRRQMQDLTDALNFGMDVLIGQPLLLAQQVTNLVLAPGRAAAGIVSRLDGYGRLAGDIFGSDQASPGERLGSGSSLLTTRTSIANEFHTADLFGSSAIAGSILSVAAKPPAGAPPTFTTRTQAIAAAAAIAEQFDLAVASRDAGFAALASMGGVSEAQLDTGESYQALQSLVAKTMGYLVQTSLGLQPEKRITLDRDRTIIDLSGELYKTVDEKLDLLITSNDLTGDQILELQRGTEIVYYPDSAR
jgi:DNA circularisation protein N-terminus